MENNIRVFPPYFPEGCPPAEASGEEIVLFRLCKEITPSAEDFLTFYQINPHKTQESEAGVCQLRHSPFSAKRASHLEWRWKESCKRQQ